MTNGNIDRFAEALNDGARYAAKILSRMARLTLAASPARILVAEHAAPPPELFDANARLRASIVSLSGDLFGQTMLVFRADAAKEIARSLSGGVAVGDDGDAAFDEAVNIFANTAMAAITRDFRLAVYPLPPLPVRGEAAAIWSAFTDPIVQPEPRSIVAAIEVASSDRRIAGQFLVTLRRDSMANVRWKTVADADRRVDVKMGDLSVAAHPGVLKVTSLGSCLAVILYDPVKKLGAIAHVMLPNCASAELGATRPGKYADKAVDALLKSFPGTPCSRLHVWLIGGAHMFNIPGTEGMQIGQRNIAVAKERLAAAGMRLVAEETGGTAGRTVELDTKSGEVSIHGVGSKRIIPHAGASSPRPSALTPPPLKP